MDDTFEWRSTAAWPPGRAHVREAREFVARQLAHRMLHPMTTDVVLVVGELAANAATHGGSGFEVALERDGAWLTVGVCDASPVRPVLELAPPVADHGRGLLIVRSLSAEWGVTTVAGGGKEVWARFPVRATPVVA